MGEVLPIRKPHRMRLNCCHSCNAAIEAAWVLALESSYDTSSDEEHEPRIDSAFGFDDSEEHGL